MASQNILQAPTGTRDLYPIEAARRRFITEAWRRVSINHGFEEIDGPTFETTELYTKKSGEGIVSEIFGVFSGKDEAGVKALGEKLARGEDAPAPYALRPEFTPTLARMYAAKAASLPKPTKWFSVGPYFRAERPQRGRLREFLQWNADVIGLPSELSGDAAIRARREADADTISCVAELLISLGLSSQDVTIRINDREAFTSVLESNGVSPEHHQATLMLLDRIGKIPEADARRQAEALGIPLSLQVWFFGNVTSSHGELASPLESAMPIVSDTQIVLKQWESRLLPLQEELAARGLPEKMVQTDIKIVRGLAYYTGTVFEVIVDNERAVAGGGRYDNLIELFGGPPTPAVGFGMGDVVLSLVLQDKDLMPSDAELMGLVGQSPDVFVISSGSSEAESQIPKLLATLRRGTPRTPSTEDSGPRTQNSFSPGLHARRSYKTTKNVSKLFQEAAKAGARFAVIIGGDSTAKLKDMTTGAQDDRTYTFEELPAELRRRLNRG